MYHAKKKIVYHRDAEVKRNVAMTGAFCYREVILCTFQTQYFFRERARSIP